MRKLALILGLAVLLLPCRSKAEATTTINQTSHTCNENGCFNAMLQDGELFSSSRTSITFRGQTYNDGTPSCTINLCTSQTVTANNRQFVVNETFSIQCLRGCTVTNTSGSFTLKNEVFEVIPTAYGDGTFPLSGTGQVELAVKSNTDTVVTLTSSDPSFTVPSSVTITAGSFVADFTVTAQSIPYPNPGTTATITATFPDGYAVNITVTDATQPPPE